MSSDGDRDLSSAEKKSQRLGGTAGSPLHQTLLNRIESATVRVGIIGLGYVGLPLGRAFSDRGITVLGFDVDPGKVAMLKAQ